MVPNPLSPNRKAQEVAIPTKTSTRDPFTILGPIRIRGEFLLRETVMWYTPSFEWNKFEAQSLIIQTIINEHSTARDRKVFSPSLGVSDGAFGLSFTPLRPVYCVGRAPLLGTHVSRIPSEAHDEPDLTKSSSHLLCVNAQQESLGVIRLSSTEPPPPSWKSRNSPGKVTVITSDISQIFATN